MASKKRLDFGAILSGYKDPSRKYKLVTDDIVLQVIGGVSRNVFVTIESITPEPVTIAVLATFGIIKKPV